MIEQYIYNIITTNPSLQALLSAGSGAYNLYPSVIPRGKEFDKAVAFSVITTFDAYPTIKSMSVQFNIFAKVHSDTTAIASALYALFNEANNRSSANLNVVYSQRSSETDLGFDFDSKLYQREATYYFKIR